MFSFLRLSGGKFILFFSGGERGEGKSSFADVGFGAGLVVCKCAFPFAVGFLICSNRYIVRM